MHFVRPDGVYRTSVLQAIPGYHPVTNAQEVAQRFTAAPYFATALNGAFYDALPWWTQMKMRWQAWVAQRQGAKIQAMLQRISQGAPAGSMQPSVPGVAQLPASTGPGSYGVGPANEAMANVGAQITAGIVKSGDDIQPPSVASPELPTAQAIAPNMAMVPADMARMVRGLVPPQVSEAAITAAVNRFNRQRQHWFG